MPTSIIIAVRRKRVVAVHFFISGFTAISFIMNILRHWDFKVKAPRAVALNLESATLNLEFGISNHDSSLNIFSFLAIILCDISVKIPGAQPGR